MRIGAYFLDVCCLSLLLLPVSAFTAFRTARHPEDFRLAWYVSTAAGALLFWLFYAVSDGRWGATPGKWLLSLRVCHASSTDPPGLGRAFGRALAFWCLLNLGLLAYLLIGPPEPLSPDNASPAANAFQVAASLGVLILVGLGYVLLVCTMRERNRYRGLHEIV